MSASMTTIITNLSNKSSLTVLAISIENADITFKPTEYLGKTIAPGETLTVNFSGKLPEKSFTVAGVKIAYGIGLVTPIGEKEFFYTVMNGEKPEYDAENPYVALSEGSGFSEHIKGSNALGVFDRLGLTPLLEIIYNIVYNFVGKIVSLFM